LFSPNRGPFDSRLAALLWGFGVADRSNPAEAAWVSEIEIGAARAGLTEVAIGTLSWVSVG